MGDIEDNIHAQITQRGNVDVFGSEGGRRRRRRRREGFGEGDLEALAGQNGVVR